MEEGYGETCLGLQLLGLWFPQSSLSTQSYKNKKQKQRKVSLPMQSRISVMFSLELIISHYWDKTFLSASLPSALGILRFSSLSGGNMH